MTDGADELAAAEYDRREQEYLSALATGSDDHTLLALARSTAEAAQTWEVADYANPAPPDIAKYYDAPEVLKTLWQDLAAALDRRVANGTAVPKGSALESHATEPGHRCCAYVPSDRLTHPLDYRIARQGGVALYWSPDILASAVNWFVEAGHHIVRIDATGWDTHDVVHTDIAAALDFPSYYGHNLNALADCLDDVAEGEYGWPSTATGLVIVIDRYDVPLRRDRPFAEAVLDVIARTSTEAALLGKRVTCLVQTDNPRTALAPRTAPAIGWNPDEWMDAQRRG